MLMPLFLFVNGGHVGGIGGIDDVGPISVLDSHAFERVDVY